MHYTRFLALILAAALAPALTHAASAPAPDQGEAGHGMQVYLKVGCYECHGTVGQGGVGPRLAPHPLAMDRFTALVRHPLKEMPPYMQRVLSDEDLAAIHAYLASIKPPPPLDSLKLL